MPKTLDAEMYVFVTKKMIRLVANLHFFDVFYQVAHHEQAIFGRIRWPKADPDCATPMFF
jgi:hypothetical protein